MSPFVYDLMLTILNFEQSWSPSESHPHTTRQRKHFRNWWLRVAGKESHKSLPTARMYTYIYIKNTINYFHSVQL